MTTRAQHRLTWVAIAGLAAAVGAVVWWLPVGPPAGSEPVTAKAGPALPPPAHPGSPLEATPNRDAEIVARLRRDVETLRQRVATLRRDRAMADAASRPPPGIEDVKRTAAEWRDRGDDSAAAMLETLLWASAGGDVARVRSLVKLDPAAVAEADALWAELPDEVRPMFQDPLDLVATLTAVSVPLGTAKLWGSGEYAGTPEPDDLYALLEVAPAEGKSRRILVFLGPEAPAGDSRAWRISVPASAVAGYRAMLTAELP